MVYSPEIRTPELQRSSRSSRREDKEHSDAPKLRRRGKLVSDAPIARELRSDGPKVRELGSDGPKVWETMI